jgi:hypothetical protein
MMPVTSILFLIFVIGSVLSGTVIANTDAKNAYETRLNDYNQSNPVQLSPEESQIIIDGCDVIKQNIVEARDRVSNTNNNRAEVYSDIEKKLSAIQIRMSKQGIDTSVIDLLLANYRIEFNNFKATSEKYLLVLSDTALIDCKSQPDLFKSAVLTARQTREQLAEALKRIRNLYDNSFVSSFELLERQLDDK